MGAGASDWGQRFASAPVEAMRVYEEVLVAGMFISWANVLLDEVAIGPGEAVLDVACGPGTVARVAAERVGTTGRVRGADISAAMLAVASAKEPPVGAEVTYIETPAAPLAIDSAAFDVVVCQQGLQFFPDRLAALREMRRAMRPTGRVGIAVWTPIEEQPAFAALHRAVEEVLGADVAGRYRDGPWGYGTAADLEADLTRAGFGNVRVGTHQTLARFPGGADRMVETLVAAGISDDVAALSQADRERLRDAGRRALEPLISGGQVVSPTASLIAVAHA